MKKLPAFIFILIISFSLIACGNDDKQEFNEDTTNLKMKITINDIDFIAALYDNDTARDLASMLPITVNMSAAAHEKYYYLPGRLPVTAVNPGTIQEGDIMLWGADCLVLFYESFSTSYSYTEIGRIDDTDGLAMAAGSGSITITFSITDS